MFQKCRQIGRYIIITRCGEAVAALCAMTLLLTGIFATEYFGSRADAAIFESSRIQKDSFAGLSKEEMELLLEDADPLMLKRLKEDPEMKRRQIENIRQLFAIANQAVKEGIADEENTSQALRIMDAVVWSQAFEKEKPQPAITDAQIERFYGAGANRNAEQIEHSKELEEFLKVQTYFAIKNGVSAGAVISDEEKTAMRGEFARIKIRAAEAKAKVESGALPEKFARQVRLQIKLQRAQFLARAYTSDVLEKKTQVTDDDVKRYLAEHADIDLSQKKKAEAEKILQRAKAGEDFAKLAKEFSEDPGSRNQGGLYVNVTEGSFDSDFEKAALALAPGQIAPEVVETALGYHVIRLEKKRSLKDASGKLKRTYDVRHIFFSTGVKDPANPDAGETPVKEYVKSKIKEEKENRELEKIVADNPVSIAEDFRIRDVSEEEIRKIVTPANSNARSNVNAANSNRNYNK